MTLAWERRGVGRARAIDGGAKNTDAASGRPLRASTALSFFSRLPRAALPPQPSTTAASRRAAATRASARAGAPASEPPSAVACCPALSAAVKIPEVKNAVCHVNVVNMQFQIVEYACLPTGVHPSQTPSNMGLNYAAEGVRNYTLYFPPASQVMARSAVCARSTVTMISNRRLTPCLRPEPHGNRNRGGDRDLGMLRAGARARRASGPGARGVGVRYGNGLFPTHKSLNFILASLS